MDQRVQVAPLGMEAPSLFQPLNKPEAAEFQLTCPFHNHNLLQEGEKNAFHYFYGAKPRCCVFGTEEKKALILQLLKEDTDPTVRNNFNPT